MYVYNVQEYGQGKSISGGYGSSQSDDNDSKRDAESVADTESESRWKPGTEPDAKPDAW